MKKPTKTKPAKLVKSAQARPKTKLQPRRIAARWAAFLSLVSAVAAYQFSLHAYPDPRHASYATTHYTLQNIGMALIVEQLVLAWVVKRLQGGVYWFWWLQLQRAEPTEKQAEVRGRVFTRAYGTMVVATVLFLPGIIMTLSEYTNPARNDLLTRAVWIVSILAISLPSILAAWDKDS